MSKLLKIRHAVERIWAHKHTIEIKKFTTHNMFVSWSFINRTIN